MTFEDMRGYWPLQADDPTGIAAHLDNVNKYVQAVLVDEVQSDEVACQ